MDVRRTRTLLIGALLVGAAVTGCAPVRGTAVPAPGPTAGRQSSSRNPTTTGSRQSTRPSVPSTISRPTSSRTSGGPTSTPTTGPTAVVRAYFDAINARDYRRAWDIGGKNTGKPYADFAAGFATTDHDVITIQSVNGPTVTATLTAHQTDGTQKTFQGTYTVTGDTITRFEVRATG
ncbi:hypothetical protein [Actinokineospora sp. NBRC 105648]|uniref:hypothetical protein n=1 Tax=Actinokineospora sp. NBRC 105648 TaxID=3032206 RepID=UPI0024A5540F|nr:hypothetical protein [Actinokineospora sp. NBRC 105648]GLZ42531.1 hypothetical protein Acsp05_61550 [Actinokineospora sp. NBRC 105648]